MEYRRLGRTGLKVSEICLGAATFGWTAEEDTARRIVHRALDLGINFFDTANVYGSGASERMLASALKGYRDQVVLATKFRGRTGNSPNDEGGSRCHIMAALEQSLKRLETDYIDLYQMHAYDQNTPLEETLSALNDLVRQGKVRYIGCSNFTAWQLCKSLWISDVRNYARFDAIQPEYSLLYRGIEAELLPLCLEEGVGVIVYSPLAGGFLSGKYRRGQALPKGTRADDKVLAQYVTKMLTDVNFDFIERLEAKALEYSKSLSQLALAWTLSRPGVTSAIIGASRPEQIDDNAGASRWKLTEEELSQIDKLVPEGLKPVSQWQT